MNKSLLARLLAVTTVMGVLAFGFSPAASAATTAVTNSMTPASVATAMINDPSGPSGDQSVCPSGSGAASTPLLPVVRWADATGSMHSRLDNTMFKSTAELVQRNALVSGGMTTGNLMWGLGTGLSSFAINFCVLGSMGGVADSIGANIGKVMIGSPLLIFIMVFAVIVLIFQGRRRGGLPFKTLAIKGALVGLLAVMVAGSTASTGGTGGSSGAYHPGVMSPGWIVTTMNSTLSSLASAPAAAVQMQTADTGSQDVSNPLSCRNYLWSLRTGYQNTYGQGANKLAAGVPLILSTMWEQTGLQTWRQAQFGVQQAGDPNAPQMDDNSWCRQLEWNSNARTVGSSPSEDTTPGATTVRGIMSRIMPGYGPYVTYESPAFSASTGNDTQDKSLVAWAACHLAPTADPTQIGSWSINQAYANGDAGTTPATAQDCLNWFTQVGNSAGAFDWPQGADDVQKRTTPAGGAVSSDNLNLRDFIETLHGNNNVHGMTAVFAYNISAAAMLAVFGLTSIGIIVAKIAMVVMIFMAFFLVIACLMPSANLEKLGGAMKMLFGLNLFVFGVQMLFAMIAILTNALQTAGNNFLGGPASLVATIWSGLSPLIAVFLLHMMFTKVLKVPSPFKLSSGLAWGAMTGGAAGAAFHGMTNLLDRHQGRAGSAAKGHGKRGANAILSKVSGGKLGMPGAGKGGRRGAAVPGATGGKGEVSKNTLPGDISGNGEKSTEGISAENLIDSKVSNSRVHRGGKMAAGDRRALHTAAKEEAAAAKVWDRDRRESLGLTVNPTAKERLQAGVAAIKDPKQTAAKAGEAIKNYGTTAAEGVRTARRNLSEAGADMKARPVRGTASVVKKAATATWNSKPIVTARYSNAMDELKKKPLRTSAKYAAGGILLAATTPALAVPAVAAGVIGAKKGIDHLRNRNSVNDGTVDAYREAMKKERTEREKQEAKAAKAKAGRPDEGVKMGTSDPQTGTTSDEGTPAQYEPLSVDEAASEGALAGVK